VAAILSVLFGDRQNQLAIIIITFTTAKPLKAS